jgi:putative IMPACT (imprinted ancient) family translation regulator
VRAYTQAARDGIDNSVLTEKIYGTILEIGAEYTDVGKLQYLLAQQSVPVLSSEYLDKVSMRVILPAQDADRLIRDLTEATAGRADIKKADSTYYCEVDGEIIM